MASELKLSGTTARVILQGNDSINSDQTFTFPDTGGEVVTSTFDGDVSIDGSASFTGAIDCAGVIANNGNVKTFISSGDGALYVYNLPDTGTPTVIINKDGSSQFMGQLQISSASVGGLTEKVLLHEQGWVRVYNATSDASANMYLAYSDVNGDGTVVFYVTADGQVNSRSTAISQIGSERRIKRDIELIDPVKSWETIRDLPYYGYKLKGNNQTTYYGPIVDECPEEMIREGSTSDEEGNIRTYDNSLLQGRLFVALQEALTRIEQLESRLAQLEGQS